MLDSNREAFGSWLRGLRESKGVPIRAVAAAAEMDQSVLSKIELGQRFPTVPQGRALARYFRVKWKDFEARRLASVFLSDNQDHPALQDVVRRLAEETGVYGPKPAKSNRT
jgi:transcriptional regulator with XRE-family HTH domain